MKILKDRSFSLPEVILKRNINFFKAGLPVLTEVILKQNAIFKRQAF